MNTNRGAFWSSCKLAVAERPRLHEADHGSGELASQVNPHRFVRRRGKAEVPLTVPGKLARPDVGTSRLNTRARDNVEKPLAQKVLDRIKGLLKIMQVQRARIPRQY